MMSQARSADCKSARERRQGAVRSRQNTAARGWIGRDPTGSGRQADRVTEIAAILRNHFRQDTSKSPESHSQPDGLIVFLMPNSIGFRIAFRIRRPQPRWAVSESPNRQECGPGKPPLLCSAIDRREGARRAPVMARSQSPDWLFRAPPGRVSDLRYTGPTVAIPSFKTKGFFPLTDVCAKRENSVPTCKTGICVPSSNWFAAPGLLRMAGP
jgi:hypothetical protein